MTEDKITFVILDKLLEGSEGIQPGQIYHFPRPLLGNCSHKSTFGLEMSYLRAKNLVEQGKPVIH